MAHWWWWVLFLSGWSRMRVEYSCCHIGCMTALDFAVFTTTKSLADRTPKRHAAFTLLHGKRFCTSVDDVFLCWFVKKLECIRSSSSFADAVWNRKLNAWFASIKAGVSSFDCVVAWLTDRRTYRCSPSFRFVRGTRHRVLVFGSFARAVGYKLRADGSKCCKCSFQYAAFVSQHIVIFPVAMPAGVWSVPLDERGCDRNAVYKTTLKRAACVRHAQESVENGNLNAPNSALCQKVETWLKRWPALEFNLGDFRVFVYAQLVIRTSWS